MTNSIIHNDYWNSGLEDIIIRPIAQKAVDLYADRVIEERSIQVEIDGYKVRMLRNNVIENAMHTIIFPHAKNARYMINVEVCATAEGQPERWFVGIYYKFDGQAWLEENTLKELTTYESNK